MLQLDKWLTLLKHINDLGFKQHWTPFTFTVWSKAEEGRSWGWVSNDSMWTFLLSRLTIILTEMNFTCLRHCDGVTSVSVCVWASSLRQCVLWELYVGQPGLLESVLALDGPAADVLNLESLCPSFSRGREPLLSPSLIQLWPLHHQSLAFCQKDTF